MATMDSPTRVTPVFDKATNIVLGNIYNYLKSQAGKEFDDSEITERLDELNDIVASDTKARGSNDRAVQAALKGLSDNQKADKNARVSNDRATQAALKGLSDNQKKEVATRGSNDRATQKALKGIIGNQTKDSRAAGRDRATQKALFGKLDKDTNKTRMSLDKLGDSVKDTFDKLKNFLSPYVNKSLSHYTNMAKWMRAQNLSSDQKQRIGVAADKAFLDTKSMFGLHVAKEDISKYFEELVAGGKDVELMGDRQRAAYAALRQRGIDDEKAYNLAMSGNHTALSKMIRAAGDPKRRALIAQTVNGLEDYELAVGDFSKNLNMITDGSATAAKSFSATAIGTGKSQKIMAQSFYAATNQFEKLEGDAAATMGRISTDMSENINNTRKFAENMTDIQRRALGTEGDYLNTIANASANIKTMGDNGSRTTMGVRGDSENRAADGLNTKDGTLQDAFDKAFTKLNLATGGTLSKVGNVLDEIFGDSADIGKLVGSGFKIVTLLLSKVVFNTTGGIMGMAFRIGGAFLAVKLIKSLIENKDKLQEFLDPIKEVAKEILPPDVINMLKGIFNTVTDIFKTFSPLVKTLAEFAGSAFKKIKEIAQPLIDALSPITAKVDGLFGFGGKQDGNATSFATQASSIGANAPVSASSMITGIGGVLKNAMPLILDGLSKSADFILKHMESDIIPFINDTLVPRLQEIIPKIAQILNELLKALSPVIGTLLKEFAPVIGGYLIAKMASVFGFGAIKKLLWNLPKLIFNKLSSVVGKLGSKIVTKLPALAAKLPSVLGKALMKFLPTILTKVLPLALKAVPVVGWIITGIQAVMWVIKTFFPDTYNKIMGFFNTMWQGIKSFFTETIPTFFTETLPTFFTETMPAKLSEFGDWIWGHISGFFSSIWEGLKEFGRSALSFITEDIPKFFTETLPNTISEFKDKIFNWFSEKFSSLINLITNLPGKIGDFITALPDKILDGLRNILPGVDNVVNGIGEAVNGAWGWITGAKNGVITSGPEYKLIGEAGKEVVLPLTRPKRMASLMSQLSEDEISAILMAIEQAEADKGNSFNAGKVYNYIKEIKHLGMSMDDDDVIDGICHSVIGGPGKGKRHEIKPIDKSKYPKDGIDYDTWEQASKILEFAKTDEERSHIFYDIMIPGVKLRKRSAQESLKNASNTEGKDRIAGTPAEKALEAGASQLGKPYILQSLGNIGYVCNELTNYALKHSGADLGGFYVNQVASTFSRIMRGKDGYGHLKIRDDLTPDTAPPGMLFFQDSKSKDGTFSPGHVGLVYYGHKRLHSSGGASNFAKDKFLATWQSNKGVVIDDFPSSEKSKFKFGELPSLFVKSDGTVADVSANGESSGSFGLSAGQLDVLDDTFGFRSNDVGSYVMRWARRKLNPITEDQKKRDRSEQDLIDFVKKKASEKAGDSYDMSFDNNGDVSVHESIKNSKVYEEQSRLLKEGMSEVEKRVSNDRHQAATEQIGRYIDEKVKNGGDIKSALDEIIRYLRDVAFASKVAKHAPAAKPMRNIYQ